MNQTKKFIKKCGEFVGPPIYFLRHLVAYFIIIFLFYSNVFSQWTHIIHIFWVPGFLDIVTSFDLKFHIDQSPNNVGLSS